MEDRSGGTLLDLLGGGETLPSVERDPDNGPYTAERGEECARLYARGDRTLTQLIDQEAAFPSEETLYRWLADETEFAASWRYAEMQRADRLADLVPEVLARASSSVRGMSAAGAKNVLVLARLTVDYLQHEAKRLSAKHQAQRAEKGAGEGNGSAFAVFVPLKPVDAEEWMREFGPKG
jgi:hypothetical protein